MKFRSVLLGCLATCVLASTAFGAKCQKAFDDSPVLSPIQALAFNPLLVFDLDFIGRISPGNVTFFVPPGSLYINDKSAGTIDSTSADNETAPLCGGSSASLENTAQQKARPALSAVSGSTLLAGQTNEYLTIGDFNGDGIPDSAAVTGRGIFVTLRRADGRALSSTLYPIPADTGPSIVGVDFNRDGFLDLAITQGASATQAMPSPPGNVVVLLENGDGTFGAPKSFPVGTVGSSSYLATGDFNGDGFADLAVTNFTFPQPNTIAVLLGKGDGSFAPAATYPGGGSTLVAADFNGDGKLDLASLGGNLTVLLDRGDGTFQAPVSSVWGKTFGFLGFAELNHDGKLDLLIADRDASSMIEMLGNGNGSFQARKEYLVSAQPKSIVILPLDDGNTSVFTADNASNNLFFFFVTSDGTVHSPELQTLGSGPAAVAAADLNGDRQPDLASPIPKRGRFMSSSRAATGSLRTRLPTVSGRSRAPWQSPI